VTDRSPAGPSPEEFVDALRTNSAGLVDAADRAGLDAPVPTCPDWTVADLLGHVGRVQHWAAAVVTSRAPEPVRFRDLPRPPEPSERPAWVRAGAEALATALTAAAPDAPIWTFSPAGPDAGRVAFWQRRQAHEAAIHRYDAETAAGTPSSIAPDLAADGIDELLTVLAPYAFADRLAGQGETIHLHCTDREGEWVIRLGESGLEVERTHAKSDVAVRGPASDLFLLVHNRRGLDGLEVFGDQALLDRWRELARL
jgi:uncharacterized protein (TIGR03083 family)